MIVYLLWKRKDGVGKNVVERWNAPSMSLEMSCATDKQQVLATKASAKARWRGSTLNNMDVALGAANGSNTERENRNCHVTLSTCIT